VECSTPHELVNRCSLGNLQFPSAEAAAPSIGVEVHAARVHDVAGIKREITAIAREATRACCAGSSLAVSLPEAPCPLTGITEPALQRGRRPDAMARVADMAGNRSQSGCDPLRGPVGQTCAAGCQTTDSGMRNDEDEDLHDRDTRYPFALA
jgi:hypothetical protein